MDLSPDLLARIRGEFLEMPDLKITTTQGCRLWSLNESQCREALDTLIAEGFLVRAPSGAFIAFPSATRMAKATASERFASSRCPHCQHLNSIPVDESNRLRFPTTFRCVACARVMRVEPASA